jgi:hypothetical protein
VDEIPAGREPGDRTQADPTIEDTGEARSRTCRDRAPGVMVISVEREAVRVLPSGGVRIIPAGIRPEGRWV